MTVTADLVSPELEPRTAGMFANGQVRDDWTFNVTNIFGPSRIQVSLPAGWAVKSVLQGDRSIEDLQLDMRSGDELTDVEIIVTDRVTRVSGQLIDEKGAAVSDATVLLFASDSTKWFDRSRWIRAVRPDNQGRFEISGLPPGEYFAIGVDYVQDGVWNDPEYLNAIVQRALKVIVREEALPPINLKVIAIDQ